MGAAAMQNDLFFVPVNFAAHLRDNIIRSSDEDHFSKIC
jgi:hypothetical protein